MGNGTVLVVEDEADIQLTIRLALEMSGYEVTGVSTAEEALEELDRTTPSAVLLDITLPGMDGWAMLQELRERDRLDALRVIVVSAHVSDEVSKRAATFGARFLTKPFDVAALRRILADVIDAAGA